MGDIGRSSWIVPPRPELSEGNGRPTLDQRPVLPVLVLRGSVGGGMLTPHDSSGIEGEAWASMGRSTDVPSRGTADPGPRKGKGKETGGLGGAVGTGQPHAAELSVT